MRKRLRQETALLTHREPVHLSCRYLLIGVSVIRYSEARIEIADHLTDQNWLINRASGNNDQISRPHSLEYIPDISNSCIKRSVPPHFVCIRISRRDRFASAPS